jgi:predicted metal-binding membrane protein
MLLQPAGLISGLMLWSKSAALSAIVLALAGAYQFSPLKRACLRQCRSPVRFLATHWRPGMWGVFVLGMRHGAYCVGCCWMLMTLLFVGGVMNVVWIARCRSSCSSKRCCPAASAPAARSGRC